MTLLDFEQVIALLRETPGVVVRDDDSREATARYLERNPGFSFVAEEGDTLAGFILSGHDGRRGYLHHLVVAERFRHQGTGRALVEACLDKLEGAGILKSHIAVLTTNAAAISFWEKLGWQRRTDIFRYSHIRAGGENV
jgi:ribosomal protein S18 acetylase RimI-like enzyme